jgi:peptide-methionine (R)-S-oxide reductase
MSKQINPNLNDEQKDVLFNKATEAPFSGEYLNYQKDGTYLCVNCLNPIFDSNNKFESHCGWPSFDRAVEGSTKKVLDESHGMIREEVVCAKCGGHLGHVFNDGPKDTTGQRYCINSLSLNFKKKR